MKFMTNREQSDVETEKYEEEDSEENEDKSVKGNIPRTPPRELFLVALDLKEHIRSYASSWYEKCPPLAHYS